MKECFFRANTGSKCFQTTHHPVAQLQVCLTFKFHKIARLKCCLAKSIKTNHLSRAKGQRNTKRRKNRESTTNETGVSPLPHTMTIHVAETKTLKFSPKLLIILQKTQYMDKQWANRCPKQAI